MDRSMTVFSIMIIISLVGLIFALGGAAGHGTGRAAMRREAVKAGVAHYAEDTETGKSVFTWMEMKDE